MIIVFDAKCLLCSAWVRFLLMRRGGDRIRFASMQGETGRRLLRENGLEPDVLRTLLVVGHGRAWQNTAAIGGGAPLSHLWAQRELHVGAGGGGGAVSRLKRR
jgi:predicted DCC family thiol-disulfide oxidoreductase YuxK